MIVTRLLIYDLEPREMELQLGHSLADGIREVRGGKIYVATLGNNNWEIKIKEEGDK